MTANSSIYVTFYLILIDKQSVYEGDVKTKLRIELIYIDPADKSPNHPRNKKEITLYSNEYAGSINPAQFWRKQGYSPSGIMDPYND